MNMFTNTMLVLLHGLAEEKKPVFLKCFSPVCKVEYKHGEYTHTHTKRKNHLLIMLNFNMASQTLKGK